MYATDTWHLKPSLTLNYGLSYAIEMPPHERDGDQVMWVDTNGNPILTQNYMAQRSLAASQGQVYNPEIGFALVSNVNGGRKYPYNPYFGALSPRISAAWNPHFRSRAAAAYFRPGRNGVRGGYGRIYGRINGDLQMLNPLLSPSLILGQQCRTPQSNGSLQRQQLQRHDRVPLWLNHERARRPHRSFGGGSFHGRAAATSPAIRRTRRGDRLAA